MALLVPGSLGSIVSGKVGGVVFSRNRGGAYVRSYAIPTKVTSERALEVKAAFTAMTLAFGSLSDANRLAWEMFARENPVSNRIGQLVTLKGQSWFIGLNSRQILNGDPVSNTPPIYPAPATTVMSNFTVDVNGTSATLTLTEHEDDANVRAIVYGARSVSGGRQYVENLYTHVYTSSSAPGTSLSFGTELAAALGAIQEGVTYHIKVEFADTRTGRISASQYFSTVAVDTTP